VASSPTTCSEDEGQALERGVVEPPLHFRDLFWTELNADEDASAAIHGGANGRLRVVDAVVQADAGNNGAVERDRDR
jgi:hypothetical protein